MNQIKQLTSILPKTGYLAAALALRLLLAPFLSHPFDMRIFMAVGAAVSQGITPYGQYVLQNLFVATPHPHLFGVFPGIGYPPLWGLISGEMYSASSILAPNNLYAYILALKIPIMIAELLTAILVYNIIKAKMNEKVASKAFLLFAFCPFLIVVGTVWGMFDVLALFFALVSAYSFDRNWRLSALFLSVASTLKVFPLLLAPLFSVLISKSTQSWTKGLKFLLLTILLTGLFTFLPMFAFNWPLSNMFNALGSQVGATSTPLDAPYSTVVSFPYGAASPFNVFTLLNSVISPTLQPPLLSVYLWIPAVIAVYLLLFRSRKTSTNFGSTMQWSLLLMLALFTTRVWVSEQNLVFLFAFLALSVFLQNPKSLATVQWVWILLFTFVLVHVPAISFLWLPYPWTLNAASAFSDGPLGWTRLLSMTILTLSAFGLSWNYAIKKLRWKA